VYFYSKCKSCRISKAIVDISKFNTTICDENLDGTIEVNLNNVTSAILLNPGIYQLNIIQILPMQMLETLIF
jgi:hypothetical protein